MKLIEEFFWNPRENSERLFGFRSKRLRDRNVAVAELGYPQGALE
jgi:hypothetical protein